MNEIRKLIHTKTYKQRNASKSQFLANLNRYAYAHISSHAIVDDEDPRQSFISFSQMDDTLNRNQLLYVDELYHLNIPTGMVVLSACETGLGAISKGEGIQSLARAFFYSGAKSLITTLWQINDASSVPLIKEFYRNLRSGEQKHRALRKAKLNYLENTSAIYAHPYYWSGFLPYGNSNVVELKSNKAIWAFILVPAMLFALLLFIVLKKRL